MIDFVVLTENGFLRNVHVQIGSPLKYSSSLVMSVTYFSGEIKTVFPLMTHLQVSGMYVYS